MNEDRIWEMYYSDAYQASTRAACRDRIAWFVEHARGRVSTSVAARGSCRSCWAAPGSTSSASTSSPGPSSSRGRGSPRRRPRWARASSWCSGRHHLAGHGGLRHRGAREVLEHLIEPACLVAAARRQVAEGGRLLVTVPMGWLEHHDHRQELLPAALVALLEPAFGSTRSTWSTTRSARSPSRAGPRGPTWSRRPGSAGWWRGRCSTSSTGRRRWPRAGAAA